MALPGYRLKWYQNPSYGGLVADLTLASTTVSMASLTIARAGRIAGPEGVLAVLAFSAAIVKAILSWKEKRKTRSHTGLDGCLFTLHSVLASAEAGADPGLRLTIHTPVSAKKSENQLEQMIDYVSSDPKRRVGAGRRFMQQCGILGDAYRTGKVILAVREQEDYEGYIKELVEKWHYSEDQARALNPNARSFMAVPLSGEDGVEAVLYVDSTKLNYFTENRRVLVESACVGIALFIRRRYNTKAS
jgi:hypothetical protein